MRAEDNEGNSRRQNPSESIFLKANIPMGAFTLLIQLFGGVFLAFNGNDNVHKITERIDSLASKVEIIALKQEQQAPRLDNVESSIRKIEERITTLELRKYKNK